MPKKKTTKALPVHVYIVLDRSGSMGALVPNVREGFTKFMAEQKAQPGKCKVTLVQFDGQDPQEYILTAADIVTAPTGLEMFEPRGNTPLWDAQGMLITTAEHRVKDRKAAGKAEEAILFVTITDGAENASTEWTATQLASKKEELSAKGWVFTDLALGNRQMHHAQSAVGGTVAASSVANSATAAGVASSYDALNYATSNVRGMAAKGSRLSSSKLYAGAGDMVTSALAAQPDEDESETVVETSIITTKTTPKTKK
jgi:uncharacterized protein YegL